MLAPRPPPDRFIISYSKQDSSAFVRKLALALKERHFNIWLDQLDLKGGAAWDSQIQMALDTANVMIVVLSKHSVESG
jgi:hypothetical protein